MSDAKKKPYERPTLDAKEMFGAEAVASCCKVTVGACASVRSGLGKSTNTSTTS